MKSFESEIMNSMAAKAILDLTQQEDKRVMKKMAAGSSCTGCYMPDPGEFKAFDKAEYRRLIKGMTKEEMFRQLMAEAESRYNFDCEVKSLRFQLQELDHVLESQKISSDATIYKWKNVAKHLSDAVQSLVLAK